MSYFKKIFAAAVIILIAGFVWVYISDKKSEPVADSILQERVPVGPVPDRNAGNNSGIAPSTGSNLQNNSSVSGNALLNVSFLAQAPFGIWEPLH